MVSCEYKYPHEVKKLALLTNFNRSTGTYAPEFIVVHQQNLTNLTRGISQVADCILYVIGTFLNGQD